MNQQDRFDKISAKLAEDKPRAWIFPTKPDAQADGVTCVGEFVRRSSFVTREEGKEIDTVVLRVGDELRSIALFHPPLKSQLGPGVKLRAGELIGVTYEGMAKSRLTDRHYHNYKIAREDEVAPDEPLSDVPSDWDGAAPPTPAPVPVGGPVDERDDDIPF